ncbi:hypothetical protein BOX15_Mlig018314g1 [Macrostomum lignano]|uniref:Phosphatidylinositol-4,5-bisphosphate 4-phosphatase n=1 Tax=Macrostomum lignano TaxID=282301 RepID=A0A267G767_9PLAT|nr:hypothetical protein BOX15_Mlig018314g2 [Macrostomum lignano]PAA81885.1 hypothetical protein BOX15_Mlig018314g1 [Macrostomum lignano]
MAEKESLIPQSHASQTHQHEATETAVSVTVTPTSPGFTTINCQICSSVISLEGKYNQHVVKCQQCGEATPIKSAPPGKKYVRCACNCLLICKATGRRIACPRENCKRIITLTGGGGTGGGSHADYGTNSQPQQQRGADVAFSPGPGQVQCLCGHCGAAFTVPEPASSPLARCPQCRKVSSVGPHYVRTRSIACISTGLALLTAAVLVMAFTWNSAVTSSRGLFALYVGLMSLSFGFLIRGAFYCRTKVSIVESRGIAT